MNLHRTLRTNFPHLVGIACTSALAFGLVGTIDCTPYPTFRDLDTDCSADSKYDFLSIDKFESGQAGWWGSSDKPAVDPVIPDAAPPPPPSPVSPAMWDSGYWIVQASINTIPEGPRCSDSTAALVLHTAKNYDWGSVFGRNALLNPKDAHAYEGLSFWARSPGNTGKSFTVILDDTNTASGLDTVPHYCKDYDAGVTEIRVQGNGQPGEAVTTGGSGTVSEPDACGNGYSAVVVVTSDWALYTIPFKSFQQAASANRVPNPKLTNAGTVEGNGLLTSELMRLSIRMPKEATTNLWIDNLAYYRIRLGGAEVDAAQE